MSSPTADLSDWLKGHPELCRRVTGRPLSHKPLMIYLRNKYAPLYGL